jgi:Glycosyl hydrolases family 28
LVPVPFREPFGLLSSSLERRRYLKYLQAQIIETGLLLSYNPKSMNRRDMLVAIGLVATASPLLAAPTLMDKTTASSRVFDIKKFGALGDGKKIDTAAINMAIDACNSAGGGTVYLPPGTYLSGTVVLKSNVTLYLEAGATLLGSKDVRDYTSQSQSRKPDAGIGSIFPTDLKDAGPFHLVFARDAENLALAGPGKIDGQGPAFWTPSGRVEPAAEEAWRDVIAFDWKPHPPRPSPMLEFYNCKNLRIEDVRIENAAGWTMRPINCDKVFIRGITIKNPVYGPNTDGMDLTCCQNVFISDCLIDTGDDAICLKSENPYGGELRVSKNITVTNCVLSCCCNGFKFGTATHGGFENITFSNSVIFNDDVPLNARVISGIALEMVDGGWIDGVLISNIRMQRVRTPIFIRRGNRKPRPDGTPGTVRGVMIENIQATNAISTSSITGINGFEVEDVTLSNIRIDTDENGEAEWVNRKIPEEAKAYPESRDFGRLPAYGLYCRHVTGLRLSHVEFKTGGDEARPSIVCDDVKNLEMDGIRGASIKGTEPVIKLIQSKQAFIRGCCAPVGTKVFLEVQGSETESIVLTGNNLLAAEQGVQSGADVPGTAVIATGNVAKS